MHADVKFFSNQVSQSDVLKKQTKKSQVTVTSAIKMIVKLERQTRPVSTYSSCTKGLSIFWARLLIL